jgi:carboxyl-terminal processing protease
MKKFKLFSDLRSYVFIGTIFLFSFVFISFNDTDDFELAKNLDIYQSLIRELRLYYVDEIHSDKIIKTSIDKMLASLDPYTVYYPESKIEDFKFMTTGKYGGVGALIRKDTAGIVIEEVYKDYPAYKAGIRPGDIIKMVENIAVNSANTTEISDLLKGVPNTSVNVKVYRPYTNETKNISIQRQLIKVKNVPYYGMINPETGYIKLTDFTQTAYEEVKKALLSLKEQKAKYIVFDLRGNPGGLLNEAVDIVSLFVEKGTPVVSMKGKMTRWNQSMSTKKSPVDKDIPLIVLINRNSASASEIVSGALQDLDRAVIIGERSFGKGLVQTTRDLSYNTKLKITTAKYYIPSGRCIQALDYSHRNPDGSVGHVPDSLISEFKTKNGRTVYDGGGILPDIINKTEYMNPLAQFLTQNNIIFDYANRFYFEHDSISPLNEFILSDDEYNKFMDYLIGRNIKYKSGTDKKLQELIKTAKSEKYYDKISDEINQLQQKLKHDVRDDLIYFKDDIKRILTYEIIKRYYFRSGLYEYDSKHNSDVLKSLTLFKNIQRYNEILNK